MHWRRKWQPTPVFLPGEFRGRGSLVGCCLWGRTESDTTEATYSSSSSPKQGVWHIGSVEKMFSITIILTIPRLAMNLSICLQKKKKEFTFCSLITTGPRCGRAWGEADKPEKQRFFKSTWKSDSPQKAENREVNRLRLYKASQDPRCSIK